MKWRRNGLDDRRQRERRRFGRVAQTGEDWCLQKRRRNWRRFGSYRTGRKIVWRSRRKINPYRLSSAVRIRTRGSVSRRELDAHSFLLRFVRFGHGNLDSESANWDSICLLLRVPMSMRITGCAREMSPRLRQQIVASRAPNLALDKFADRLRFRENNTRIDVRSIRFSPSNQWRIDEKF